MSFAHRQAAFVAAALAVVSGITGILAWWLPSSATWLNRHGFVAWPLAILMSILFVWALTNWYQLKLELAAARISAREPVQEDQRLFRDFKRSLPKDSPTMIWLLNGADDSLYRWSDVAPLYRFAHDWRDSNKHYVNKELEQAAQRLVKSAFEFLSFQSTYSGPDPRNMPDDDTMLRIPYQGDDRRQRELQLGLGKRADTVLAAHNELYMTGAHLGL